MGIYKIGKGIVVQPVSTTKMSLTPLSSDLYLETDNKNRSKLIHLTKGELAINKLASAKSLNRQYVKTCVVSEGESASIYCGIITNNGDWIAPPINYEITIDGDWLLLSDNTCKIPLAELISIDVSAYCAKKTTTTIIPTISESKCGYKNTHEQWIVSPQFDSCREFHHAIALIQYQGLYGAINAKGEWLTPQPKERKFFTQLWESIINYSPDWNAKGVIDQQGNWIIPPLMDYIEINAETILACGVGIGAHSYGQCFMFDHKGKRISNKSIEKPSGAINATKKLSITFIELEFPLARAINGLWGYVDANDKWIVKPKYANAENFSEGFGRVQDNATEKWGLINAQGNEILPLAYEGLQSVQQGVFWFEENNLWGLMDTQKNRLIEPMFESAYDFNTASSFAIKNDAINNQRDQYYLITNKGKITYLDQVQSIENFLPSETITRYSNNNRESYITREGDVFKSIYLDAEPFQGHLAQVRNLTKSWEPPAEEKTRIRLSRLHYFPSEKAAWIIFIIDNTYATAFLDTQGHWLIPPKWPY